MVYFQVVVLAFGMMWPSVIAPIVDQYYTAAEIGGLRGATREEIIAHYFLDGYNAYEIIGFLFFCHGITISLRHLKRLLRRLGLHRQHNSPIANVVEVLLRVVNETSRDLGYRFMWRLLTTRYHLRVSQHTVRRLLQVVDPEGVRLRSMHRFRRRKYASKGPNYIIHVDGFDKLKPFGISVHAAIDGFSRRILWIKVGPSNKDPRYIGNFFIELVEQLKGVPKIVRADRGTENVLIRDLQFALRSLHEDSFSGEGSFLYGRSTANQRIEAWWSHLKHMSAHFWIDFFKDLRDGGFLDTSNALHIECLRFAFTRLIQRDFSHVVQLWNQHRIRNQTNVECPSGKPDVLYFQPQAFGTRDYRMPLHFTSADLQEVKFAYCKPFPKHGCTTDFYELLTELVGDLEQFTLPDSIREAYALFRALVDLLD